MEYIIGLGTPADPKALKLETRKRRFINNVLRPEMDPARMREGIRLMQDAIPGIEIVSGSAIYNCYGMVFAARRSAIVDEVDVEAILEDDGYHKLPWHPASWVVGDVVLYRDTHGNLKHVGIIAKKIKDFATATIAVEVLSTWGESGEYLHPIDRVHPLLGKPAEVFSQRFLL